MWSQSKFVLPLQIQLLTAHHKLTNFSNIDCEELDDER